MNKSSKQAVNEKSKTFESNHRGGNSEHHSRIVSAAISLGDLQSRLSGVKNHRGNKFQARCPAHDDKNPSLSVKATDDRILMHCQAGCSHESVCEALGIHPAQLFLNGDILGKGPSEPESIYDYLDEYGKLIYQVVRRPRKAFTCRRPDGTGDWVYDLNGVERILYRLPQLKEAREQANAEDRRVYFCEGEKDVHTLESHGLLATCNPHGAGKWRDEYGKSLSGLNCVILPDNDEAGRKHADTVARSIETTAASVRILQLPGLPEKGDVTDWLNDGNSIEDLLKLVDEIDPSRPEAEYLTPSLSGLQFTTLDELFEEPVEDEDFVVDGLLPMGGISVFSGKPKVGKTTAIHNMIFNISQGTAFMGRETRKGPVLYFCLEEKRSEVRKFFRKMGASGPDIIFCTRIEPDKFEAELKAAIAQFDPVAVFIDPMARVVRVNDFNDYAQMSRVLEPFVDIARRFGVHILMTHHDGKGGRTGGDGVLGSTAIFAAVDTHIQMAIKDGKRTLMSTNRYGEDLPETVVTLDKETGLIATQGTLQEIKQVTLKEKVLARIEVGENLTEKEIKKRAGDTGAVSRMIRKLEKEGELIRSGKGGKADIKRYRKPDPPPGSELPLLPF